MEVQCKKPVSGVQYAGLVYILMESLCPSYSDTIGNSTQVQLFYHITITDLAVCLYGGKIK